MYLKKNKFRFLEKTLSEWLQLFEKSNKIPYGPINDMKGVFENEQVRHLEQVLEMKNPNRTKSVRVVGTNPFIAQALS